MAILDETDSGLDIDALRIVAACTRCAQHQPELGVLLITHYQRLLDELRPDVVHVMIDGADRAVGRDGDRRELNATATKRSGGVDAAAAGHRP